MKEKVTGLLLCELVVSRYGDLCAASTAVAAFDEDGDDHEDSDDEARELSQYASIWGMKALRVAKGRTQIVMQAAGNTPLTPTSGRTSSNSVTGGSSTFGLRRR